MVSICQKLVPKLQVITGGEARLRGTAQRCHLEVAQGSGTTKVVPRDNANDRHAECANAKSTTTVRVGSFAIRPGGAIHLIDKNPEICCDSAPQGH